MLLSRIGPRHYVRQILILGTLAISDVAFTNGLVIGLSGKHRNGLIQLGLSLAMGGTALVAAWWFDRD